MKGGTIPIYEIRVKGDTVKNGYDVAAEKGFITKETAEKAKAAAAQFLVDLDLASFETTLVDLGIATKDDDLDDLEAINDELQAAADHDRGQKVA